MNVYLLPWILDYLMNSGNMKPTVYLLDKFKIDLVNTWDTTIISKKFEMALVNSGKSKYCS